MAMAVAPPLGFKGSGEETSEGEWSTSTSASASTSTSTSTTAPSRAGSPTASPNDLSSSPPSAKPEKGTTATMAMTSAPASCTPTPRRVRYASSTSMACPPARRPTAPLTRRTASCSRRQRGFASSRRKSGRGASTGLFAWRAGLRSSYASSSGGWVWCGSRGLGEDGDGDGEEDGEENGEEEGGPRARHGAVLQSHRGTLRRDRRREGDAGLRALITAYTYPSTSSTSVAKWRWERREARMRTGKG